LKALAFDEYNGRRILSNDFQNTATNKKYSDFLNKIKEKRKKLETAIGYK
jgi:hypothetical protein